MKFPASPAKWLLWAVALLTAALYKFMPFSGDDFAYKVVWHYPTLLDALIHYPGHIRFHWLEVNGRLANFLAPPLLNLIPHWAFALLCGAATWLMLYMMLRWSNTWHQGGFWSTLLIATAMLALPWWDSMQVFDCQLNYIWTTALVLSALWVAVRSKLRRRWQTACAALLCFAAGMMHESASLVVLAGLMVWILVQRPVLTSKQKMLLLTFALGAAVALCSPGIWARATGDRPCDDSLLWLFLKSYPVVGVLWIAMSLCRRTAKKVLQTPLLILAAATVPAVVLGLASGIVGRPGWFASVFAIIVLARMLNHHPLRCKVCSWVLAAIVVAHLSATVLWQYRQSIDYERFEAAFEASENGVVYLDHIRENEVPWYTLNRTRGVPDSDDLYLLECVSLNRGWVAPYPVVLPTDARAAVEDGFATRLACGDSISTQLPPGARPQPMKQGRPQVYVYRTSHHQLWTAQTIPGTHPQLYHLAPLIIDAGDRPLLP